MWLLWVTAWLSGLLFGLGLIVSGMANPQKVLAFLDLFGAWDPSLALVMLGAISVAALGFAGIKASDQTLLGQATQLPVRNRLDRRLILGSLVFGLGWGLAGFCPGPALVASAAGVVKALLFVAAMLVGMLIFSGLERIKT